MKIALFIVDMGSSKTMDEKAWSYMISNFQSILLLEFSLSR